MRFYDTYRLSRRYFHPFSAGIAIHLLSSFARPSCLSISQLPVANVAKFDFDDLRCSNPDLGRRVFERGKKR